MKQLLFLGLLLLSSVLLGCERPPGVITVPLSPQYVERYSCEYKSDYFSMRGSCEDITDQIRNSEGIRKIILADYVTKGLRDVNPAVLTLIQELASHSVNGLTEIAVSPEGQNILRTISAKHLMGDSGSLELTQPNTRPNDAEKPTRELVRTSPKWRAYN